MFIFSLRESCRLAVSFCLLCHWTRFRDIMVVERGFRKIILECGSLQIVLAFRLAWVTKEVLPIVAVLLLVWLPL